MPNDSVARDTHFKVQYFALWNLEHCHVALSFCRVKQTDAAYMDDILIWGDLSCLQVYRFEKYIRSLFFFLI